MSAIPNDTHTARGPIAASRALVPFIPGRTSRLAVPSISILAMVAIFGLTAGVGGAGLYSARRHLPWAGSSEAVVQAAASAAMMHKMQDELGRLQTNVAALKNATDASRSDDSLRGLKRSVEAMRQDIDQVRASGATNVAQLSAKIDKVDHDPTPKLAEIATRLDRIERGTKPVETAALHAVDPSGHGERPALAPPAITASAALRPAAASVKPITAIPVTAKAEVTQVPASEAKAVVAAAAKAGPTVDGWVLRDVYDGMALVQARNGGMREIEPGAFLPGAGEVRSIERRGRGWIVLTSRGIIDNTAF